MKRLACLALAITPLTAAASDFFLIDANLPDGVKKLSMDLKLPENPHPYDTPLGVTSRCFKGASFLIMSENSLGKGYELTKVAPEQATCIEVSFQVNQTINEAGMHQGMSKEDVLKILEAPMATDASTLLYNSQTTVNGKTYDEQTWVDVEFSQNKLVRLSVFTSQTD